MNYFKKSTLIFGWTAFALSTLVYLLTMEPTASLWDCSEFIATSYKMEVGHPPGAPLFMMINRIFSIFAPDPKYVAVMINTGSAIASGLTIAFLFWTIAHLGRRLIGKSEINITKGETWATVGAALVGSLAYAFTDTFWFSAVEGEVYAQSSLFTAVVFWAILKWENVAGQPGANKWLVLVAYLMGLSIGVHLLNLLAIPAIVFVYYYRLFPVRSKIGWWKAFAISIIILAGVLYVIIPLTVSWGARIDLLFVNVFSLPVNSGLLFFYVALLGGLGYGIYRTYKKGKVILNTSLLCIAMIIVGYGTYASVIIRASENPPMNSNNPSDPYALLSFLNREQYGNRPLVVGPYYSTPIIGYKYKDSYTYNKDTKKYDKISYISDREYDERYTTIFPRMYSDEANHIKEYQNWGNVKGKKIRTGDKVTIIPTFGENLQFFFTYQLNFMYWRYFLWNFVGRQNDIQSHGEITKGNWMSGIKPIDELYLGPQDNLPDSMANNSGRNRYFFLPFILGVIGLVWQMQRDRNNFTVVMWLFFMTGIAIILYLNQTPLQPRERDYAFAGSFYAFTIWIGLGLYAIYDLAINKLKLNDKKSAILATLICLSVPTILISQNWDDHDRSGRTVARDFGANYLNSTLPNSIIMPYGDNDTFPLWYIQEVEGVRDDVRVMNLSYLQSEWYADQMRIQSYNSAPIPYSLPREKYTNQNEFLPIIDLGKGPMLIDDVIKFIADDSKLKSNIIKRYNNQFTDFIPTDQILLPVDKENAIKSGVLKAEEADLALDTLTINLSGGSISRNLLIVLDMLSANDWTRPLYFTQPSAIAQLGIQKYLQLDGFAYRLVPFSTESSFLNMGRIDSDYLYDVVMNKFKFGNVKNPDVKVDYFTDYTFSATQIRNIFARLADKLLIEGDTVRAKEVLAKAIEEVPSSKFKHNYNSKALINALYRAGNKEEADRLMDEFVKEVMQNLKYLSQFKGNQANAIGNDMNENFMYLQDIYILASTYGRDDIAQELEPYMKMISE